jgi:phage FluMu gp28-like protein
MWQRKPLTETKYDRLAEQLRQQVQRQSRSAGLSPAVADRVRQEIVLPALLPYQRTWIADPSPVKVIEKSRRIGISWADAAESVLEAAAQGGQDVWYIGYNKDMAEEYILDCAGWADRIGAAAEQEGETVIKDPEGDILIYRLRLASGSRIVALSSKPSNLRGKQGRVKIDEAAFHGDLPGLLKAALALRIWGGSVSIISTHNGFDSVFNELVVDIRSGSKPYSLHRVTFDEAVQAGLCRKIFEATGREWAPEAEAAWVSEVRAEYGADAAEELDVIPAQGGATPFPRALVEQCMDTELPVLLLQRQKDFAMLSVIARETDVEDWCADHVAPVLSRLDRQRRCYVGMDFGRSGDLSVIFVLQDCATPPPKQICPLIVEMANIPHEQQRQVLWHVLDHLPRLSHAALDAGGNGSYLAEVTAQRYGSRVSQIRFSEGWYRDNMPVYQAAYQDRQIRLPHSLDVIDDHRAMRWIGGVIRLPKETGQKDRHGDSAIAGALAWFASRQGGGGGIEFHRVETRREGFRRGERR